MKEEQILVVPRKALGDFLRFRGFKPVANECVKDWLDQSSFQPRAPMEEDPSFQQIIPYILLRNGERVFRYSRTKKGGESRLHDLFSIGIGGHINPIDHGSDDLITQGALRELQEELHITQPVRLEHIGYINDDETEVGKVHFGFVMQVRLDEADAVIREDALSRGEWVRADRLLDGKEYESWSLLIIQDYFGEHDFG